MNKIAVLDKGFVELIDYMGNDHSIINAARISYDSETKGDEQDKKLLRYLIDHDHGTPLEMVQLKFKIKCPIFVMRQWIRHRIASYNEISGRYTEIKDEWYVPEKWRVQDTKNKQGSIEKNDETFNTYADVLYENTMKNCYESYQKLLNNDVAKEMARMVLPVSFFTEFIWSINLRSLINFLKLRCDEHAQYEIREYAFAIKESIKNIVPWSIEILEELGKI